jgi:hypothetical protein
MDERQCIHTVSLERILFQPATPVQLPKLVVCGLTALGSLFDTI